MKAHHPVFTVRLKSVKMEGFVRQVVEATDDQVSVGGGGGGGGGGRELHSDVFHVSSL